MPETVWFVVVATMGILIQSMIGFAGSLFAIPLFALLVIGVPLGAWALKILPMEAIGLMISAVTLMFAILFLLKIRIPLGENPPTQVGVGLLSGFLGGSISESGPPVVVYALSREWPKDIFRTTLLAHFMMLAVVAGVSYAALGMFNRWTFVAAGAALGPTLLTAWLGVRLKRRIAERHFRNLVLIMILFVGVLGLIRHARNLF